LAVVKSPDFLVIEHVSRQTLALDLPTFAFRCIGHVALGHGFDTLLADPPFTQVPSHAVALPGVEVIEHAAAPHLLTGKRLG
jgi:hypothetical protein